MLAHWDWLRRLAVFTSLIALAPPLAALAPRVHAQATDFNEVALYRGEQFDWLLFYDAAQWEQETSSEPGFELVRFSDGEVDVDYVAFAAPGLTPAGCVERALAGLAADPAVLAVEALGEDFRAADGQPLVIDGDVAAFTQLVVTVAGEDGPTTFAARRQCVALDGNDALLSSSVQVPAAVWNAGRGFDDPDFDDPEILLRLPAHELAEPDVPIPGAGPNRPPIGTLIALQRCRFAEFFLLARNDGEAGDDFVVSPAAVFAVNADSGKPEPVTFVGHLYPSGPADVAMALPPGGVGLLAFAVAQHADVYYRSASGEPLRIGEAWGPCGGAGGAAPVVIDME